MNRDAFADFVKESLDEMAKPFGHAPELSRAQAVTPPAVPMPPMPQMPPLIMTPPMPAGRPAATAEGTARQTVVVDSGYGLGQIENLVNPTPYIDQVADYLLKKISASKEHKDEFYQFLAMQEQDRKDLLKEAPFVRVNPASCFRAQIGDLATVQSGTPAEKAPQLARWEGEPSEATNFTVMLSVDAPPPGNAANIIRPFGVVRWGSLGAMHTLEVDIGLGIHFTLAGSTAFVGGGMDDDGGANAGSAVIKGQIAFRNVTRGVTPTRTRYAVIGNAGTAVVQVPPFAKSVLFYTTDATQTYTLTYKDWAGNTAYVQSLAAAAFLTTPTPLAGDIEQILVTPQTGSVTVRLVFQLGV